jgi:hypothetical protein
MSYIPDESIAVTLDVDWAPDWMIDEIAAILIDNHVKTTWFVTHESTAIDRLRKMPELFELGIHPNLLPESTQGETVDEVMKYLKSIVPEAISMRTHSLYQNTQFLIKAATNYNIKIDVSLFLPGSHYLTPHIFKYEGVNLYRLPYFWEDDFEMFQNEPKWKFSDAKYNGPGLKIFNFHPTFIILNTPQIGLYKKLKETFPLAQWTPDFVKEFRSESEGPKDLFMDLVSLLQGGGYWVKELALI